MGNNLINMSNVFKSHEFQDTLPHEMPYITLDFQHDVILCA